MSGKAESAGSTSGKTKYLIAYNLVSAAAWAYLYFILAKHFFIDEKSHDTLWPVIAMPLKIAQTMAVLEIFHSMFRVVRAPVFTTMTQVASRLLVLYLFANVAPPAQQHWTFTLMVTSWALVEVPRYLYFVLDRLNFCPPIATIIRYSLFLVLYPTGITGELGVIYNSTDYIKENDVFGVRMPNKWNIEFSMPMAIYIIYAIYVPGSYMMYTHMLARRGKKMQELKAAAAEKKQQ